MVQPLQEAISFSILFVQLDMTHSDVTNGP